MSPRSRRPSAEVQAAREAARSADLREMVARRRALVECSIGIVKDWRRNFSVKALTDLRDRLRQADLDVEILIEQTAKLEKAERESL